MTLDPKNIALKVSDLSIGYKNKKHTTIVSKGINFAVQQGELVGIVGVNGIGKSTLLRTLGNVQKSLNGNIALDGKGIEHYKSHLLAAKISVVLTEKIASNNLTVQELIALGRQPYTNWIGNLTSADKTKILEAINMVQLNDFQHKKCYELSDGQLQKVMLARALAQDTSVILMDEPTSHLDLYHKATILKLLRKIAHQTRKTILFTTHEIEVAIQLCDKILILEKDKSSFGTPKELIDNNSFDSLFPKDTIVFDEKKGVFRIV